MLRTTLGILFILTAFACQPPSESKLAGTVTATEIPKKSTTDARDSYGLFSIKATKESTNYHLAVKLASKDAPTAVEMTAYALKRNLNTTPIHVLIAQRMNAPMVDFAEKYFADTNQQTLGEGMVGEFPTKNHGAILGTIQDKAATGDNAWVQSSVLRPANSYTLYGMKTGGAVVELLGFSTDASLQEHTAKSLKAMDSTLDDLTLTLNGDELYILPLQVNLDLAGTSITFIQEFFSGQNAGNQLISNDTKKIWGGPNEHPNYDHRLYLFKDDEPRSHYCLMDPSVLSKIATSPNFSMGISFSISGGRPDALTKKIKLKVQ